MQACPVPHPVGGGPSWADCSAAIDPSKSGGDLTWTRVVKIQYPPSGVDQLVATVGPTGDFAWLHTIGTATAFIPMGVRLNGDGLMVEQIFVEAHHSYNSANFGFGPDNSLIVPYGTSFQSTASSHLLTSHASNVETHWYDLQMGIGASPAQFSAPQVDLLGNLYAVVTTNHAVNNASLQIPAPGSYLLRGGVSGSAIVAADTGHRYLHTHYSGAVDFGGGALSATSADEVVVSFTGDGSFRHSRAISVIGPTEYIGMDGCGALWMLSRWPSFDPGCGTILPPGQPFPMSVEIGVARFNP